MVPTRKINEFRLFFNLIYIIFNEKFIKQIEKIKPFVKTVSLDNIFEQNAEMFNMISENLKLTKAKA